MGEKPLLKREDDMQTAMAATFSAKGIKPQQFRKEEPARPSPARETVRFKSGAKLVLVFGCSRRFVPAGIQVIPAGYGGATVKTPESDRRFSKARIDLDGLMARSTVDSINVCEKNGFCRVYVKCTIGGSQGFHFWRGAYENFVRRTLLGVWKRAILKAHPDGRILLELRESCSDDTAVKIGFAIGN